MPAHLSLDVARRVKEGLCYTAADVVKVCCCSTVKVEVLSEKP